MSAGGALSRGRGERWATEFLAGVFARDSGDLGRAGEAAQGGALAGGRSGGNGGLGMGRETGMVRDGQRTQATTTRSTGDEMPAMGGDSASEGELGEQPKGGGSFGSLESSLERMGGAGTTTSTHSGVDPKIGR